MTAINPARLKLQTAELGQLIDQPDLFKIQLHDLLNFYSERIRQTNLSRTPLRLQAYQVPEPVLQAMEIEISGQLVEDPEIGPALADALWTENWVELRRLAIYVLGILPTEDPDQILSRIQSWLETCTAEDIRKRIMRIGMTRLATEKPDQSLTFIQNLITSADSANHQAALFGLEFFAQNTAFPNLPLIYRYLSQILQKGEKGLVKEINALIKTLSIRSEQETTFFLGQQLGLSTNPRILRVTRQVMSRLSPENQKFLREKMEKWNGS